MNGEKIEGTSTKNADTTGDNVSPESLLDGYTAHDSSGDLIFGTMIPISLTNASVHEIYSSFERLMIEPEYLDDRHLNITLDLLDNYGHNYTIVISVST